MEICWVCYETYGDGTKWFCLKIKKRIKGDAKCSAKGGDKKSKIMCLRKTN